jgi:hypothetical protein
VAARSKAWTVLAHSNTGIMGSNPTQGMDVCVCVYSVFVLSCVYVEALRRTDHSSKESYRLCKNDYETEEEARVQRRSVQPLMNEWNLSVVGEQLLSSEELYPNSVFDSVTVAKANLSLCRNISPYSKSPLHYLIEKSCQFHCPIVLLQRKYTRTPIWCKELCSIELITYLQKKQRLPPHKGTKPPPVQVNYLSILIKFQLLQFFILTISKQIFPFGLMFLRKLTTSAKSTLFWDMIPCTLIEVSEFSVKSGASILWIRQ